MEQPSQKLKERNNQPPFLLFLLHIYLQLDIRGHLIANYLVYTQKKTAAALINLISTLQKNETSKAAAQPN